MGEKSAHVSPSEIKSKTLYVQNVADTVHEERLREMMEAIGPLHKIIMKPTMESAIVEYQNVADAGKASLVLEGKELAGRPIRFVTSLRPSPSAKGAVSFVPRAARRK
jgi:RNA recognition motif-containing protein